MILSHYCCKVGKRDLSKFTISDMGKTLLETGSSVVVLKWLRARQIGTPRRMLKPWGRNWWAELAPLEGVKR